MGPEGAGGGLMGPEKAGGGPEEAGGEVPAPSRPAGSRLVFAALVRIPARRKSYGGAGQSRTTTRRDGEPTVAARPFENLRPAPRTKTSRAGPIKPHRTSGAWCTAWRAVCSAPTSGRG